MKLARRARDAASEAVIAGAVVGAIEATQIVVSAGAGSWAVVAAVAALGAVLLAGLVGVALAFAGLVPPIARWGERVRSGDVRAIGRGVLALGVVLTIAGLLTVAAVHLYEAKRDHFGEHAAFVFAIISAAAGFAVGVIAVVVDRRVIRRLDIRTLGGGARAVVCIVVLGALVAAPVFVANRALPALTLTPVVILGCVVSAVGGARALRVGERRFAWAVAVVIVVLACIGTFELKASPASRGAIVSQGTTSLVVARKVWAMADHDGDRFASASVGGADCDDNDAKRNPRAVEIPGNGVDENCTGGDAQDQGARGTARPVTPEHRPAKPQNVVLISIDALRADHLGAYGYTQKISPTIDALAASGVRFAQMYTSCPSTRCAIPSMLTGRYISTLRANAEPRDVATLGGVFQAAGYETAAITCCARFALATREMAGFAVIDATADAVRMQRAGQSNADVVVDNALAWLGKRDPSKPYMLWIHLYEPHFPYHAPAGPDLGDSEVDRYDAEIAYADTQLARLMPSLDPATTVVALTADHGDEFGEHGIRFHARSLFNQVVRIPLIVRAPGAAARVVATPVSLVDMMPTLLELAGVDGPAGMNGESLAPALRGEPVTERPLLMELIPDKQIKRDMAGVVSAPWKVIWDREANAWSVFELSDTDDAHDRESDAQLPTLQKLLFETLDRETSRLP